MSSAPAEPETPARPVLANGKYYYSPLGLFGFQAEAVAQGYYQNAIAVLDTGLGKTHVSMALAAQLFYDDQIDLVMHIAQRNKVDKSEFPADWAEFTSLRTHVYHGPNRGRRLSKALAAGEIDVIITTYETGREELVTFSGRSGRARSDGSLIETLGLRTKRVLWIFDEIQKLGNRGSKLYRAYEYVINHQRSHGYPPKVLGLSATPMKTDYEQPFNIGRIVWPERMPSVQYFETEYTHGRDEHGRYIYKRGAREWFARDFQPLIYRKRRTDPDVVDQMPRLMEEVVGVDLAPEHLALYKAVGELYGPDPSPRQEDLILMAQRLVASHPRALLRSGSDLARAVVATLGEAYLREMPSAKTQRLIELANTIKAQGDSMLIFSFFAETIIPELAVDLTEAGFKLACYTGGQSDKANAAAKAAFRAGELDILLSSDAGATGLDLIAPYIIEVESASTYAGRQQRFGRALRITATQTHVTGLTMVARKTVEVGLLQSMLKRNDLQDHLYGDVGAEGHLDAQTRRDLFRGMLRS